MTESSSSHAEQNHRIHHHQQQQQQQQHNVKGQSSGGGVLDTFLSTLNPLDWMEWHYEVILNIIDVNQLSNYITS